MASVLKFWIHNMYNIMCYTLMLEFIHSFLTAYLRHAPCYRNVSLLDDKCALKYKHLVQLSESVEEQKNVDEGLRESCW